IGEQSIFADPAKYANLFVRCSQAPADRRAALGACQIPGGDPLAYVINTYLNLGDIVTSGVHLQATWHSGATPDGRFNPTGRGTYVDKYEFQVEPGGQFFDANGNYSAQFGGPVIRYQQVVSLDWERDKWSALAVARHTQGYTDQNQVAAGFLNNVGTYAILDV